MADEGANEGDQWEYEYDQHATETFLIDLDLTTINHVIRPANATRAGKSLNIPTAQTPTKSKAAGRKKQNGAAKPTDHVETVEDADSENVRNAQQQGDQNADGGNALKGDAPESTNSLQLLDLHTINPVISYNGAIYSGTWYDMIGTTMFFTKPGEFPLLDPELSTKDFDLIGTTRIKLVGNEAKVVPKPRSKKRTRDDTDATPDTENALLNDNIGRSLGTIRSSSSKLNADIRRQANFLDQLMKIKKSRGDGDNVRFVANNDLAAADAAGGLKGLTDEKRKQIDELNERVVRGDGDALTELQSIYAGLQKGDDAEEEGGAAQQISVAPTRQKQVVLSDSDEAEND